MDKYISGEIKPGQEMPSFQGFFKTVKNVGEVVLSKQTKMAIYVAVEKAYHAAQSYFYKRTTRFMYEPIDSAGIVPAIRNNVLSDYMIDCIDNEIKQAKADGAEGHIFTDALTDDSKCYSSWAEYVVKGDGSAERKRTGYSDDCTNSDYGRNPHVLSKLNIATLDI